VELMLKLLELLLVLVELFQLPLLPLLEPLLQPPQLELDFLHSGGQLQLWWLQLVDTLRWASPID
jgi:hypothetical protein